MQSPVRFGKAISLPTDRAPELGFHVLLDVLPGK
jgi:hypothetical protein